MIRRYSATCKNELLLMIWIDWNQDFPVSYFQWLVEQSQKRNHTIEQTLSLLDATVALCQRRAHVIAVSAIRPDQRHDDHVGLDPLLGTDHGIEPERRIAG